MAYVVGLTGGIGSGKTAVADAFAALGVEIVDADALAHRLSGASEPGFAAIRVAFGDAIVGADGELDRAALRRLVFADVAARRRLEAILHPLIRAEAERQVRGWRGAYGIVVVPLLLEHEGLRSIIDRILVVDCPEEEQVRRVVARSGLNVKEVRAIMATQLDRARRRASADDILDNSGTISAIAPQVQLLDQRYRELAAAQARG
ncbi:MAG: dephospho-CoA kinase [Betaproteobacteria bacterium]|nr:MAG: dephospho-CoA kinase [Betaproteobacteria bacterium]